MAGGVVNLEEVRLEDYKGNKGLYYSYDRLGAKVCGCIIWTKNGTKSFCLSPLEEGKNTCLVKAHANKPKAMLALPYVWFMTVTLSGRSGGGGPAAIREDIVGKSYQYH